MAYVVKLPPCNSSDHFTLSTPSSEEPVTLVTGRIQAQDAKARSVSEEKLKLPLSLSLEDFKTQNLAIRIRSSIVGEEFWLTSNESVRDHLKAEGLAVYLAEEIPHLKGLSSEGLGKIHMVKKAFGKCRLIGTKKERG